MIGALKKLITNKNIDGYIVPKNDEFFSEYAFPNRLQFVSKFSGSAGLAIILKEKNLLFVDGRYTLQANIECGKNFKIFEIPKIRPFDVLKKRKNKLTLGFDPKLFTEISLKSNFKDSCNLSPINKIFGLICENRSITPVVPKSGEQEDHIAPRTDVLIYAITVSGKFGKYAATRSPLFISFDFIHSEI